MTVESSDLDQMQAAYKTAVDNWISTIREEETLASGDHSETEIDTWEAAGFREEDAREKGQGKEGLRRRPPREVLQLLASPRIGRLGASLPQSPRAGGTALNLCHFLPGGSIGGDGRKRLLSALKCQVLIKTPSQQHDRSN